ncbi:MAG: thioredoxin family protein [Candidatus Bathyarchaeota archaeon]|nr:thioredoxin family protein [Candidatus Bathyarchaeota archaeon]
MPEIKDIQVADWETEITGSKIPVVVEFWHQKCVACKEMKPIYEALPGRIGDRVKLTRMNILDSKENRRHAIKQGVRSTPTFLVYCDGRPIGAIIGIRTLNEMDAEVLALIGMSDNCLLATPLEEE